MTTEEKLALVAQIEEDHTPTNDLKQSQEIQVKEEPLTDDEILKTNDIISKTGKAKVLKWIQNFQTLDAKPTDMKIISEIIHQSFNQNKAIKEQQLGINPNGDINIFEVENVNVVNLLKQNGLY